MGKCKNCGSSSTQKPYYEQVGNETLQDHASIFRDTQYAAGVVVKDEFQIPAVDQDIQVCVKNVINVVVGSYLWHPSYGSLKIVYWDGCSSKLGLLNEGLTGTAAPGSVVPECTAFVPSSRPCCADQDNFQLFPFLAEDFEAPAVDQSRTIQVTSTFGLVAGTYVRIGTGVYFLQEINSSLEIVIRNDGAGATPGTTVEARDSDGDLQYLITSELASPCVAPVADTVAITGCGGADQAILEGDYEDQVPVLINPSTNEAQYKLLDTTVRVCTSLTAPVNITPGVGAYTFSVDDASDFTVGDVLEAQSSSIRYEITSISSNDIEVDSVPSPAGVTETLLAGEWLCKILVTEDLQDQIDSIVSGIGADFLRLDGTNEASLTPNVLQLDKIQQITTDRLLGRDTAGTGDIEQIAVSGGLEFSAAGSIRRSALTGDVTASAGSNATTIANNAVTTAKIINDAVTTAKILDANVTLAKMANIATDRLIGRDTAGTGVPEALTVSGGVEFSGAGGIRRSALTGDVTASAGSNATTIAAGAVSSSKLATTAATRRCPIFKGMLHLADGTFASVLMTVSQFTAGFAINEIEMPVAGQLTHISLQLSNARTAGIITVEVFVNGVGTGIGLVTNTIADSISIPLSSAVSFNANDILSLQVDTSAVSYFAGAADYLATLWGVFTAP